MLTKNLLFDWGDTLMVDYPQYKGSMAFWEKVAPMPGVMETMPLLYSRYKCVVVSNAGDSDAALMRQAFSRIALDKYFSDFLTSKELQAAKPSLEFFQAVINKLQLSPRETVMIGNDYEKDIAGAKNAGLKTVFITSKRGYYPHADYKISSFWELADIL